MYNVDYDELETRFSYSKHHKPTDEQKAKYITIRGEVKGVAQIIARNCPRSWELSLALNKLEEAVMWANAAIARRSE